MRTGASMEWGQQDAASRTFIETLGQVASERLEVRSLGAALSPLPLCGLIERLLPLASEPTLQEELSLTHATLQAGVERNFHYLTSRIRDLHQTTRKGLESAVEGARAELDELGRVYLARRSDASRDPAQDFGLACRSRDELLRRLTARLSEHEERFFREACALVEWALHENGRLQSELTGQLISALEPWVPGKGAGPLGESAEKNRNGFRSAIPSWIDELSRLTEAGKGRESSVQGRGIC